MAVGDEWQRCALFPESKFFASVEQKRAGQAASLEQFTEAVLRRVTSEVAGAPASARAECAVLMWAEFLGGWMTTSFSGQYCEETRRQWMSVRHGKPNDGGHFRCQVSCQMAPETPTPGEGTRSRSGPQPRRGSRSFRNPLTLLQMD